jgi:hypothetical protein
VDGETAAQQAGRTLEGHELGLVSVLVAALPKSF